MRSADAIAMGDGGKSLNVGAENFGEKLCLGVAQLRELLGHVRHRAMMLADLLAGRRGGDRRGITIRGEHLGECANALVACGGLFDYRTIALLVTGQPMAGERLDRFIPAGAMQIAQRLGGQSVIGMSELVTPGIRQGECSGGATASALTGHSLLASLDQPVVQQGIEMTPHRRRSEVESFGQLRRGGRALRQQTLGDTQTRRGVVGRRSLRHLHVFHNISVPLFVPEFQ